MSRTGSQHQTSDIIDRLNVMLDQIRTEQEDAKAQASTMQYQSYAEFYEQVKAAQDTLRTAMRNFDRAQSRGARTS